MAVIQTRPYYLGETAQLVPADPLAEWATVFSPSNVVMRMQRAGSSPIPLVLTQVGVWRYQFDGEEELPLEVVAPPQTSTSPPAEVPQRPAKRPRRWPPPRGV